MSSNLHKLINNRQLAEIGQPSMRADVYFAHGIELLTLITQHASQMEHLSRQLARCVLPRGLKEEPRWPPSVDLAADRGSAPRCRAGGGIVRYHAVWRAL